MDEEVGIEIKDEVAFVYSSSFVTDDGHNVINVVFLCEYDRGTAHSKSADEVVAVHWMTCDEIMNHPDAPHGPRRASEEQHWLGDSRRTLVYGMASLRSMYLLPLPMKKTQIA